MAIAPVAHDRSAPQDRADAKAPVQEGGIKGKLNAVRTSMEQHAWVRVLESTVQGFLKDKIPDDAAAMTYYGIFSLFPLILLFMSLAGLALQSNDAAREQIMNLVTGFLPQGDESLRKTIGGVIQAKGAAAGIGILMLLWSALGWFQVIDTKINEVWGISKGRSFVKGKLFALAMVGGIGGIAIASWGATAVINVLEDFTGVIPGSVVVWQAAVSLLSVLMIAVAFYLLYRYTPRREVQFADVWPAALTMAILWEVTRRVLAFYLAKTDMVSGYGPVGAAMALLFWIYVASVLILIGAELTYAIAKERRHIQPAEEMEVVAPPGEQPTAKFAPQIGVGHSTGEDQDEPTRRAPSGAAQQARAAQAVAATQAADANHGTTPPLPPPPPPPVAESGQGKRPVPRRDAGPANWQAPSADQPAGWQKAAGSVLAAALGAAVVVRQGIGGQRNGRNGTGGH